MNSSTTKEQAKLKKLIFAQIVLVAIGVIAFFYVSTQVSQELQVLNELTGQKEALQIEYNNLKKNVEQLYSVRVTPENLVYELKATAKATGRINSAGKTTYNFSIYINAPEESLNQIEKVHYFFDHPSFSNQHFDIFDKDTAFSVTWIGWGCLFKLPITVHLKDGTQQAIDFNMCKNLGWNVERKSKNI